MSEYIVDVGDADELHFAAFQKRAEFCFGYPVREEIVRCRDCKFYILDEFDEAECHQFTDYYDQPVHWPESDGFCAWGKRRDGEQEVGR